MLMLVKHSPSQSWSASETELVEQGEKLIHSKTAKLSKRSAAFKSLGEKSCEIKGGGQEMAAMMSMLINFNNAHNHY